MIRVGDIARIIEEHFHPDYALPGDNCGLQAGSADAPVRTVMAALDATPDTVARAVKAKADLLLTHHPLFFEPLRSLDTETPVGAAAGLALSAGLAVYSAHTSLDAAPRGLAWELARRAGVEDAAVLEKSPPEGCLKMAVYVPEGKTSTVYRAMVDAGAGRIGNYEGCAFMAKGEGLFRPLAGARPAIGRRGVTERVAEVRIEMLLEHHRAAAVIAAMKAVHPYEEPAFDLFPVRRAGEGGLARIGRSPARTAAALAKLLAKNLKAEVRLSGRFPARIERIVVVPGSGGGYVARAARAGAQVLVTGEVRYHNMLEAEHFGLGIAELGHDRSELPAVDLLAKTVRRARPVVRGGVKTIVYKRPRAARTGGENGKRT